MPSPLIIRETKKTPFVSFDQDSGLLEIKGRSISEDSYKFYTPLLEWVDEYKKAPGGTTKVAIQLEYFNSSSAMRLFSVLKKLTMLKDDSHKLEIFWHCEKDDEDMMGTGKDYEAMLSYPIGIIERE